MNRVLVAGIAGVAMLVSAVFTAQDAQAARKCGGGGLLSNLGGGRCGGQVQRVECAPRAPRVKRDRCGGGLLAKLQSRKNDCCAPAPVCCEPAPVCCEPAPVCCPAPAPTCCPAPAPTCCPAPAPSCCSAPAPSCGCNAPVVSSGCSSCGGSSVISTGYNSGVIMGSPVTSGCANCSQSMDSGIIMESSVPSSAPPAPAPTPDPAADAPSA